MTTTVGSIQLIASIDTSRYKTGAKEIESANKSIEDSTDSTDKNTRDKSSTMSKSLGGLAKFGFAALATVAVTAFAAITSRIDNAVKRVDSLVAFPRVLQAMGVGAGEAESATAELSERLTGLPTALQEGTRGVQNFVAAGLDVGRATDLFLGVNNAILAAGGGAEETSIIMEGLTRAISAGEVPSSTLQAILSRMPTVMAALTESTGKSQDELMKMFETDPQSLIDNIITLNEEGTEGFATLETQAREATGGIGTAFDNLGNAIDRSWQKIVETIGGGSLEEGQKRISDVISGAKVVVDGLTNAFILAIQIIQEVIRWLQPLFTWISENKDAWELLKTTLLVIGAILLGIVVGAILVVVGVVALVTGLIQHLIDVVVDTGVMFTQLGKIISDAVQAAWKAISDTFSNIGKWFTDRFNEVVNGIKRVFAGIGSFFRGLWNSIVKIFTNVGTVIGSAIGNTFKNVINGVLSGAVNIINGFIDAINTVVDVINNIPGVDIGNIGRLPIPQLAQGGIVSSATLAMIGEGSEPEAVIPLSKLDEMLNGGSGGSGATYNITIQASANMIRTETEKREFANMIFESFNQDRRAKSLPEVGTV
jgi:tape measure domain-containing protein